DEAQAPVERAQHPRQIVASLQDQTGRGDHAIGTLPPRQLRRLLDTVERRFASAAEDGEHRLLAQRVDGVIAPFAARDFPSVDAEDLGEFPAIEGDVAASGWTIGMSG